VPSRARHRHVTIPPCSRDDGIRTHDVQLGVIVLRRIAANPFRRSCGYRAQQVLDFVGRPDRHWFLVFLAATPIPRFCKLSVTFNAKITRTMRMNDVTSPSTFAHFHPVI
jgi:hypothetical protein